jgi:hypothetical protein
MHEIPGFGQLLVARTRHCRPIDRRQTLPVSCGVLPSVRLEPPIVFARTHSVPGGASIAVNLRRLLAMFSIDG